VRRALAVVALVAGLAGCAVTPVVRETAAPPPPSRDETVVLLPGADGKVGALTIVHEGHQQTLDAPYATARVQRQGQLEDGGRMAAEQVQQTFGRALDAQPPRPVRFLLYFLGDSDDFTPESKLEIPKILTEIAGHPSPEIVVVGHTDRVGSLPYNDALSLRRAERVRVQLEKIGVPNEQIRVAGRGEREPLVPTEDEVAEPRNRRVEITVR
jgi:outer membrane protein OmpA-like peptidoglycan-associated protein